MDFVGHFIRMAILLKQYHHPSTVNKRMYQSYDAIWTELMNRLSNTRGQRSLSTSVEDVKHMKNSATSFIVVFSML